MEALLSAQAVVPGCLVGLILLAVIRIYLGGGNAPLDLVFPGRQRNVLLVIAHPDDESMFFVPSIRAAATNHTIRVMCLSNGDYDGKGKTREKELIKACELLGIPEWHVAIVDSPKLQDGHKEIWTTKDIMTHIEPHVVQNGIGGIITFDGYGISGHPNHIALHRALLEAKDWRRMESTRVHRLQSVPLLLKFIGPICSLLPTFERVQTFYLFDPLLVWKCLQAHRSQAVWYRNLFVIFSRYTYANSLVEL